jgi:hypothetical protein
MMPLLVAVVMLPACASNIYMGIPLTGGGDPTLRSLAQRASDGDKQAQLDLGIMYEEGIGIPVDIARAEKLYRLASADGDETLWIYSPSPGGGAPGRVLPIERSGSNGLPEARARLNAILHAPR